MLWVRMMAYVAPTVHWNTEHASLLKVYIVPSLYNVLATSDHAERPIQHSVRTEGRAKSWD